MNEQKQKIISDICPFYKEYGTCNQCNTELDIDDEPCYFECMANAIINNKYIKQEWISVYERLPEENVRVLGHIHTKYKDGGEWDSILTMELRNGKHWIPFNCSPIQGSSVVTHWMPLPEPPKMKGGAE